MRALEVLASTWDAECICLGALDKIYKRRDRYKIPDWQREEVWDLDRKQQLIDSILRGWKLPKFYLLKVAVDEFEVVDGQLGHASLR